MAVAIPFLLQIWGVFSAEVGIEGKTANKKAAKKADKWNTLGVKWGVNSRG
ncbi:MAG: hypothetical protein IJF39_03930 [Clostridia bacterium]|nr:hypothetical protein [Clostridia bacterium]